nr:MAG TPA: hypothetical protein [Caudoviricetes sp.]
MIRPKKKKALYWGVQPVKKVNYPCIKANPYLLNAWNIYKNGGFKRASDELAQSVGEEIVKDIKAIFK